MSILKIGKQQVAKQREKRTKNSLRWELKDGWLILHTVERKYYIQREEYKKFHNWLRKNGFI